MIATNATIPNVTLKKVTTSKADPINTGDYFKGKTTLLFGVPGAFTPVCSDQHVPSYMKNKDALAAKGVNQIACLAVNDAFVMKAWAKSLETADNVDFLADGSAELTKALGVDADLTGFGMGVRCKRFAMLVENGVVKDVYIEENPGQCTVSSGDEILKTL